MLPFLALSACHEDQPVAPVAKAADAASPAPPTGPDAGPPPPPMPMEPLAVLTRLPDPPPIAAVAPGAAASALRLARPALRPSTYTDRILQETLPPGSAFERVAYLLAPEPADRVDAVLLTFAAPYRPAGRWQAVLDAAAVRLGPGQAFKEPPYEGVRWAEPGYRIELRVDGATGAHQLLFHQRGGRDLGIR